MKDAAEAVLAIATTKQNVELAKKAKSTAEEAVKVAKAALKAAQ